MKKTILPLFILLTTVFSSRAQDVPFTQRLSSEQTSVRGNITFVSNNIVNRKDNSFSPNDSYDGDGVNGQLNVQYIDIDNDDTTFSSSSSSLNLPSCSKVVYAGLYWSAVYAYETWEGQEARSGDYRNIKFKLPGQEYQDITSDEIIYDNGIATQRPYVCYKDMTSSVVELANPNGDYFAANIRGTVGLDSNNGLGGTAGWILVVIYENSNEKERYISLFDGFSTVDGASNSDVLFSGIQTSPTGPVKVKAMVAALEGDQSITGDRFQLKDANGVYKNVFNQTNSQDNFFNSSITQYDTSVASRNPASTNTLGFDVDLFDIDNSQNDLIVNNQSTVEARFTTSGDVYWPFLSAIAIEVADAKSLAINTIDVTSTGNAASGKIVVGAEGGIEGYKYSINDGEYQSSNSFFDLQEGSYKVMVQDANGCISDPTTVTIDKIVVDNTVTQVSDVLEASYKSANSYQWIDVDMNEAISGANQATYQPTKSGRYQVEMVINQTSTEVVNKTTVNKSSTQTVLSPVIEFNSGVLGVDDVNEKILKVYPNPASDVLVLPIELLNKDYKIYSILGKEVQSSKISTEEIKVHQLAKGVYILKVKGYQSLRFVKK